jgi:hypothetical protein
MRTRLGTFVSSVLENFTDRAWDVVFPTGGDRQCR